MLLRRVNAKNFSIPGNRLPDGVTCAEAARIVGDVRERGDAAVLEHAIRLGDLPADGRLLRTRDELEAAWAGLEPGTGSLLDRTANRIRRFALAQRAALTDVVVPVPGGRAGHSVAPVDVVGCYAPGGRFPLPSSVLMTAVTARAAGVPHVVVASPRPTPVTLAAAAVAGADALLAVGGAQAIAAFAFGTATVPRCDMIVGPGNRFVTAAKQALAGQVGIDMLAGPSELVVLADDSADPGTIAADLLAQAEHDPDAMPVLVTTSVRIADAVEVELERQLSDLSTAATARAALQNGAAVLAASLEEALAVCDRIAPEHLELIVTDARSVAAHVHHYGALFVGGGAAEVFADYGIGPNHVLPTGGTARFTGGLSVFTFLRVRTWLEIDEAGAGDALASDAAALARLEGLEAHARAAERRVGGRH